MANSKSNERLRVVIQQPALPKYRVAVFKELAQRQGIDLLVSYADEPNLSNMEPDGFEIFRSSTKRLRLGRRSLMWDSAQLKFASKKYADVLILTGNANYLSLIPAMLKAKASGVKTLLWTHGQSKATPKRFDFIRRRIYRMANGVLLYSHRVRDQYLAQGWDPDQVHVAPNAIDQVPIDEAIVAWQEQPGALDRFCEEQGIGQGPLVLFVARLDPSRKLERLIEAAGRLANDYPGLQMIVIGQGKQEQQRLKALAEQHGVGKQLHLLGGIYKEHELAPWFLSADVFCFPSQIGLSLMHAMGYGLPVITTDKMELHGPEIEALRDGENGLLYRDADVDDLCKQLRRLFDDDGFRNKLGDRARQTIQENRTVPRMVDGIEAAIRSATK